MGWGTFFAGQAIGSARRAGRKQPHSLLDYIDPDALIYHKTSEDWNLTWWWGFGGILGAHRFKTRKYISGILFLFTFGGCVIFWVIDGFKIAKGEFKFEDGLTGREKNPSNLKRLFP